MLKMFLLREAYNKKSLEPTHPDCPSGFTDEVIEGKEIKPWVQALTVS